MASAYFETQKAIYAALVAANVCDGRIYDRVPKGASYPYCSIGDDQFINDGNACWGQNEVFATVHVWDRADEGSVGHKDAKEEAFKVRDALQTEITIPAPFKIALAEHVSTRFPRQPDALSTHAVLTFRYILQL